MSKAVKLKNNLYLDTRGIVHNKKILNTILFPIGYVYLSVNNTNPGTIFGGTWEQISGYYLYLGTGGTKTDYTGIGTQGHRLTAKESGLPNHQHSIEPYGGWGAWGSGSHTGMINQMGANKFNQYYANWCGEKDAEYEHSHNIATYQVYAWKRVS